MRSVHWQPETPTCQECGFDWNCPVGEAVAEVESAHASATAALRSVADPLRQRGERWSAAMYVWHLVDVLRIGMERLLTLRLEPGRGIPCWDENELARVRQYDRLSPAVGLAALGRASRDWVGAATTTPADASTRHPEYGQIDAADVIRRTAHEVRHHVQDIERS